MPEPVGDAAGERREHGDRRGDGRDERPRAHDAVAPDLREEEHEPERRGEEACSPPDRHHYGEANVAIAHESRVDRGPLDLRGSPQEKPQQCKASDQACEGAPVDPTPRRGLHQPEDEQGHPEEQRRYAHHVGESFVHEVFGRGLGEHLGAHHDDEHREGHAREERHAPRTEVDDDRAEGWTERRGDATDAGPGGDGTRSPPGGHTREHDGHGRWRDERPSDGLHGSSGDQHRWTSREGAQQACCGEH